MVNRTELCEGIRKLFAVSNGRRTHGIYLFNHTHCLFDTARDGFERGRIMFKIDQFDGKPTKHYVPNLE